MPDLKNVIVAGAGFAGVTAAYWAARQGRSCRVILVEKEPQPLPWVSTGTTGPVLLGTSDSGIRWSEEAFPEGWPEVERILEKWGGSATRAWLASLGLELSEDADRSFSATSAGQLRSVLAGALQELEVDLRNQFAVESVSVQPDGSFRIWSRDGQSVEGGSLLLATGGERNHGLKLAREFGLEVRVPEPAYLRLRLASPKAGDRLGPVTRRIGLRCLKSGQSSEGPATVSSRGLEGPAVSMLGARLHGLWKQMNYRIRLDVDWFPGTKGSAIRHELESRCQRGGRRPVGDEPLFGLNPRQWGYFLSAVRIDPQESWSRLKSRKMQALTQRLKADLLSIEGMGLPASERAWAGGVGLSGLDLNSCRTLRVPGLHCAGEMLDFVGLPGGPHLNVVWGSGYLAGCALGLSGRVVE